MLSFSPPGSRDSGASRARGLTLGPEKQGELDADFLESWQTTENCRRSLKSCCLFSNRSCAPLRVRQELTMRHFLHWSLRIVAPARFSKSELLGS